MSLAPPESPSLSRSLLSHPYRQNPCWFSQPDVMGTSLPSTIILNWGTWFETWALYFSSGVSETEIFLLMLNHHSWMWFSRFLVSTPPTSLGVASCLFLFFSFLPFDWMISTSSSRSPIYVFVYYLSCCWFPLVYFSFLLIVFFISNWFFLYFLSFL